MEIFVESPYSDKTDPSSSHSIISEWVKSLPEGSRIIDIGTATGTLGRMCQGLNLIINGVEFVDEWVNIALPFYNQIFTGSIDGVPDGFLQGYSAVICADILEHTPLPDKILGRLVNFQKINSLFFISVPNVANIFLRWSLLLGRFDYVDRGILDRTHLRFFTRKSILGLITSVGLDPMEVRATPIPLDLLNPFYKKSMIGRTLFRLLKFITGLFPTLLGYQFVIKAKK